MMVTRPLPAPALAALGATPGTLAPLFAPASVNYTLSLLSSSVSEVTFDASEPSPCGGQTEVTYTADGRTVSSGPEGAPVTIPLDRDRMTVTATVHYTWHAEAGSRTYTVEVVRPSATTGLEALRIISRSQVLSLTPAFSSGLVELSTLGFCLPQIRCGPAGCSCSISFQKLGCARFSIAPS